MTNKMAFSDFFCPRTGQPLMLADDESYLASPSGNRYPIYDGIPELLLDSGKQEAETHHQDYYRMRAAES